MKLVKSLLLGAPAAMMAFAGANAADLPSRKAAPVAYVKICDAYGAGFFYIPGTDTCLKVGGYVRAQYEYTQPKAEFFLPSFGVANGLGYQNGASAATFGGSNVGAPGNFGVPTGLNTAYRNKNTTDATGWMARGRVDLDARTQSAWGTVRTVIGLRLQSVSGQFAGQPTSGVNTFGPTVEAAFVQFAGFTAGRAGENFAFMPPFTWTGQHEWAGYPAGIKQLAYTATFGGGFSATLAIEDSGDFAYMTGAGALGTVALNGNAFVLPGQVVTGITNGYGGISGASGNFRATAPYAPGGTPTRLPALVGNIRIDQAWGSAQIMATVAQTSAYIGSAGGGYTQPASGPAVGNNNTPGYNVAQFFGLQGSAANGYNGSSPSVQKTGFAVGAGLKFNLPMLAAGDALYLTAAYADGFLDQIAGFNTNSNNPDSFQNGRGVQRFDQNFFVTPNANGTYSTANTKAFSLGALLVHYWAPTWRSVFAASYANITPPGAVRAADWSNGGLSQARVMELSGSLIWAPVTNFDIGLELAYRKVNQSINCVASPGFTAAQSCAAFAALASGGVPLQAPGANGSITQGGGQAAKISSGDFNARLRIQRTF